MVTMTPNDHVDGTPSKGCFADFMQFHVYTQSHYTVMNKPSHIIKIACLCYRGKLTNQSLKPLPYLVTMVTKFIFSNFSHLTNF